MNLCNRKPFSWHKKPWWDHIFVKRVSTSYHFWEWNKHFFVQTVVIKNYFDLLIFKINFLLTFFYSIPNFEVMFLFLLPEINWSNLYNAKPLTECCIFLFDRLIDPWPKVWLSHEKWKFLYPQRIDDDKFASIIRLFKKIQMKFGLFNQNVLSIELLEQLIYGQLDCNNKVFEKCQLKKGCILFYFILKYMEDLHWKWKMSLRNPRKASRCTCIYMVFWVISVLSDTNFIANWKLSSFCQTWNIILACYLLKVSNYMPLCSENLTTWQ